MSLPRTSHLTETMICPQKQMAQTCSACGVSSDLGCLSNADLLSCMFFASTLVFACCCIVAQKRRGRAPSRGRSVEKQTSRLCSRSCVQKETEHTHSSTPDTPIPPVSVHEQPQKDKLRRFPVIHSRFAFYHGHLETLLCARTAGMAVVIFQLSSV